MITDRQIELIVGALLHDIGKVVYRSGDGRDHSVSGYEYLRGLENNFREKKLPGGDITMENISRMLRFRMILWRISHILPTMLQHFQTEDRRLVGKMGLTRKFRWTVFLIFLMGTMENNTMP